jgi:hypothetical protein
MDSDMNMQFSLCQKWQHSKSSIYFTCFYNIIYNYNIYTWIVTCLMNFLDIIKVRKFDKISQFKKYLEK